MNVHNIKDISAQIKARRKSMAITQAECATFCGVGNRFISELENGKESIHLGKALHVIQMLGLKVQIIENESN